MKPNAQEHSPTPWKIGEYTHYIADANGNFIGKTGGQYEFETDKINAARIVACVNACDGLDTSTLAGLDPGSVKRNLASLDGLIATLRAELEQVKAEAQSFGEQFARLKVERQNLEDELRAIKEKAKL